MIFLARIDFRNAFKKGRLELKKFYMNTKNDGGVGYRIFGFEAGVRNGDSCNVSDTNSSK